MPADKGGGKLLLWVVSFVAVYVNSILYTNVSAEVKKFHGGLIWKKPLQLQFESAYKEPADPVIYFGRIFVTKNNSLYIISTGGELRSSIPVVDEHIRLTKTSVSDGVVYAGSDKGGIYAYSTNGELLWEKDAGSEKYGASPTAANGIVAVPSIDKGLTIFDKTGELLAHVDSDSVYSAPLILDKGNTLVFATESGNIVSYDIGKKARNWSKGYNKRFLYPLVGTDEIIAVSRADGNVIAVNPADGSLLWSQTFDEIKRTRINPGFTEGKLILAGSSETNSTVIIVDGASGQVISKILVQCGTIASPFIFDRAVYIGTESGKVYCYNFVKNKYDWTYYSQGSPISMVVADRGGVYALSEDGLLKIAR
jgi:outer membrane protein assembly factor BamB